MSHHRSTFPLSMTSNQLVRSRPTAAESEQLKSDCIVNVSMELAVAALAFRDRGSLLSVGHGCQLRPISCVTSVRLTSAEVVSRRGIALTVGPIIRVSSESGQVRP